MCVSMCMCGGRQKERESQSSHKQVRNTPPSSAEVYERGLRLELLLQLWYMSFKQSSILKFDVTRPRVGVTVALQTITRRSLRRFINIIMTFKTQHSGRRRGNTSAEAARSAAGTRTEAGRGWGGRGDETELNCRTIVVTQTDVHVQQTTRNVVSLMTLLVMYTVTTLNTCAVSAAATFTGKAHWPK